MSREYWTSESGEDRKLRYIKCDFCDAKITPRPDISESGWMRSGGYYGPGSEKNAEVDYCPECWQKAWC